MTIIENIVTLTAWSNEQFENENFRISFVLAFTAWEEIGKANMLLDFWYKKSINQNEWNSSKLFRGHLKKIQKARTQLGYEVIDALVKTNPELNPDGKQLKVHMNVDHLKQYERTRNFCLHVGYDFNNQEWISPFKLINMKTTTKGMISEINVALNALIYRMRMKFDIRDYNYIS